MKPMNPMNPIREQGLTGGVHVGGRLGDGANGPEPPQPVRVAKRQRPVSAKVRAIREMAAAHRDWTEEKISKRCGQPVAEVKRALANWSRPGPNGETVP